ncbi:MAG: BREX system Lon protease-like protein BrxL [Bacteroidales bacterium]|jgi:hypothetical protein|nr:BREX system Lon protease-like protein BrxL [Bacteroidales bacterium]
MQNTESKIIAKIKKARRGSLFFANDFIAFGSVKTVSKALERLVKSGEITRVAAGIFVRPQKDNIIGEVMPDIEDIVKAIARRDKARIVPTGDYALNRLGFSTQVPMNIVYLTDGTARKIKIGNYTIVFKKVAPKNVAAIGEISRLAIQALKTIGKENVMESATAYSKLLFPHITDVEGLNKDEFKLYCLDPAIRRRGIIKEQCHKIDEEFKEYMPEIRIR